MTKWKLRKVNPTYKGGNNLKPENYRPISVLPLLSKILGKIMYYRIHNCFVESKLLFPKQFSLQINISTKHAVLELVWNITKSFEQKWYVYVLEMVSVRNGSIVIFPTEINLSSMASMISLKNCLPRYLLWCSRVIHLGPIDLLNYVHDLYKCSEKRTISLNRLSSSINLLWYVVHSTISHFLLVILENFW